MYTHTHVIDLLLNFSSRNTQGPTFVPFLLCWAIQKFETVHRKGDLSEDVVV